jgi:hypothetical protein
MNTLEKLQNYIDALYKNEKLQNIIIDCNEIIIETLKKISNESLNLDSIQYDSNNQIIENSKRTMEEARNNIISQERIDEYSSELDKAMEEYNQKIIVHMAKLLELSKKYLELKKAISIGKLNLK